MSLLAQLKPNNLLEEKEKFFLDNSYNPQFTYDNLPDESEIYKYGKPTLNYITLAKSVLDKAYFNKTEKDLLLTEGSEVSQKEVSQKTMQFLKMHGLENRFRISWSSSYVSRATVNRDTIKYRLPAYFREEGLLGSIYHEIGTHAIRRVNYEQQPWYRRKNKYGFGSYLKTEEGLAVLHALIPHSMKLAYTTASRYLAVDYAQKHSFAELWEFVGKYVQDQETRWMVTFRQKRGITDTSKPGGFSKDLVYFEGTVDVWNWLNQHDYDITQLYFGKMALEDVDKVVRMNPNFNPLLPSFFVVDKDRYAQEIEKIGLENGFNHFQ
jgi:hypothetical protein